MKKIIQPKYLKYFLRVFMALLLIYFILGFFAFKNMFYTPVDAAINLIPILTKPVYSQEDYALLFAQTGLSSPVIEELKHYPDFISRILVFQERYLRSIDVQKTRMNAITRIDQVFDSDGLITEVFQLAPYHNGYIFLTKSTYTANWRHGHAGIVIDAKRGKVLESLEPGTVSMTQNANKWQLYPTFKMLRLKNTPQEQLDEIADYAATHLTAIPYDILVMKNERHSLSSTHCAFIVWQAYKHFGIDLDSNGGIFVSPQDIAKSPYLETLQIFGFHPERIW